MCEILFSTISWHTWASTRVSGLRGSGREHRASNLKNRYSVVIKTRLTKWCMMMKLLKPLFAIRYYYLLISGLAGRSLLEATLPTLFIHTQQEWKYLDLIVKMTAVVSKVCCLQSFDTKDDQSLSSVVTISLASDWSSFVSYCRKSCFINQLLLIIINQSI